MPDFSGKNGRLIDKDRLAQKLATSRVSVLRAFWRLRAPLLGKWW